MVIVQMYIRTHTGTFIHFIPEEYHSEKAMYQALWKIQFNIDITVPSGFSQALLANITSGA